MEINRQTEMRKVFAQEMERHMAENPRIVYFDADLAKGIGTRNLTERFPDRTFNVGIAEQNMASVAAGMASYGFLPFITSFTPFVTRRICDQIAISICYAGQNVKIVGSDPGISAETNGGTHMSMEDIGVLRSIPGLVIFEPADQYQLIRALPDVIAYPHAMYIRLWRKAVTPVFGPDSSFDLFRVEPVRSGGDVTIFASGYMLGQSVVAARLLAEQGIDAEVVNVHTIKPIDEEGVVAGARKTGAAVVAENHNVIGGLGSAVAETLAKRCPTPVEFVGVQDRFGQVGKLDFLAEEYGMTPADIAAAARRAVARKGESGRRG